jgi:large subunit ribosomal protein L38e
MPIEVKDLNMFLEIAKRAKECRIKRVRKSDVVKIKARTRRYLYTFKTTREKLDEIISKLNCPKIIDVDEGKEIKGGS